MAMSCQEGLNQTKEGGTKEAIEGDKGDASPVEQLQKQADDSVGEQEVHSGINHTQSPK